MAAGGQGPAGGYGPGPGAGYGPAGPGPGPQGYGPGPQGGYGHPGGPGRVEGYGPAPGYGALRATDADRATAQGLLQSAYADGRLSWEEFDARTTRLMAAQTYADLNALTGDLVPPPVPAPVGPYGATLARRTNNLAVAALILGIAQFFGLWLLASIPAVICGHKARRQIRQTGEGGDGMALAGLILGWAGVVLTVLLAGVLVLALLSVHSTGPAG